jgi:hypothetical protein
LEHSESVDNARALVIPASLAALSADELAKVGRKATFKIDFVIMPALIVMYIFNYLDRQNTPAAKLADITTDLGLSVVQYQSCISLLFLGYVRLLLLFFMYHLKKAQDIDASAVEYSRWEDRSTGYL